MKRWLIWGMFILAGSVFSGCATTSTIRSDVTTFHEWPAELPNKTYVFEYAKEQDNSLEYRNYQNLLRSELQRLGFVEVSDLKAAQLKAAFHYSIRVRDVREIYPVVIDPYWYGPAWHGYYYGPFYDPFWHWPPMVEQRVSNYQLFTRQLQVMLTRGADGKRLFETTVVSEGRNGSLAAVMPYLVRSAFIDFPGKSGVPRRVELPMQQ